MVGETDRQDDVLGAEPLPGVLRHGAAAGAFAGGIPEGAGELMNVARFENASCIF